MDRRVSDALALISGVADHRPAEVPPSGRVSSSSSRRVHLWSSFGSRSDHTAGVGDDVPADQDQHHGERPGQNLSGERVRNPLARRLPTTASTVNGTTIRRSRCGDERSRDARDDTEFNVMISNEVPMAEVSASAG